MDHGPECVFGAGDLQGSLPLVRVDGWAGRAAGGVVDLADQEVGADDQPQDRRAVRVYEQLGQWELGSAPVASASPSRNMTAPMVEGSCSAAMATMAAPLE